MIRGSEVAQNASASDGDAPGANAQWRTPVIGDRVLRRYPKCPEHAGEVGEVDAMHLGRLPIHVRWPDGTITGYAPSELLLVADPDLQAGSLGMSIDEIRERYPAADRAVSALHGVVDQAAADLATAGARISTLTTSLRSLVTRVRRSGGYATPEEQDVLRQAERVLAGEVAVR